MPEEGLLCDLLWADPSDTDGWGENDRGVSVTFGADVVQRLTEELQLELICRSHQVVEGSEPWQRLLKLHLKAHVRDDLASF